MPQKPAAVFTAVALTVAALFTACARAPTEPTPPPSNGTSPAPPVPSARTRVSGVVFEVTANDIRPLAGARVFAASPFGAKPSDTDAAGRYEITGLHDAFGRTVSPAIMSLTALKEGYSQPCRPTIEPWMAGASDEVNIYLVSDGVLSETGTPPMLLAAGSPLSGVVLERGQGGGTPVAGARVRVDFTLGTFGAADVTTLTDREGRFVICGLNQPYRVYWDEGGADFPAGQAWIGARRSSGHWSGRVIDVRHTTTLILDVD